VKRAADSARTAQRVLGDGERAAQRVLGDGSAPHSGCHEAASR